MNRLNRFLEQYKDRITKTKYVDYLINQHELGLVGFETIETVLTQSFQLNKHFPSGNYDKNKEE